MCRSQIRTSRFVCRNPPKIRPHDHALNLLANAPDLPFISYKEIKPCQLIVYSDPGLRRKLSSDPGFIFGLAALLLCIFTVYI